jgi:hypothetical protein
VGNAIDEEAEAAAEVPLPLVPISLPLVLLALALVPVASLLVAVPELVPVMLVPLAVLVVVPSFTSTETLNAELVATNPGHDVLPITVTVVGSDAPSFIAFLPVSQEQFASPGQQYQS